MSSLYLSDDEGGSHWQKLHGFHSPNQREELVVERAAQCSGDGYPPALRKQPATEKDRRAYVCQNRPPGGCPAARCRDLRRRCRCSSRDQSHGSAPRGAQRATEASLSEPAAEGPGYGRIPKLHNTLRIQTRTAASQIAGRFPQGLAARSWLVPAARDPPARLAATSAKER
jgi:hypothetical protein